MAGNRKELILWIGPLLDEIELESMVERGECDTVSANLAEWNYLKYFIRDTDCEIVALSAIRTVEWPINKKIVYNSRQVEHFFDGRLALHNIGFCNMFGVSHLVREKALVAKAKEIAGSIDSSVYVNLFVYSMHLPFMKAASAFMERHRNSCYKLIVPDLPLNMNTSTSMRRVLKEIDWKNIQQQMKYVDGFILYTYQMSEYLRIPDRKFMVCEGIANMDLLQLPSRDLDAEITNNKLCLYAGSLDERYEIDQLVEAFDSIDIDGASLEIYGRGSGEERVRNACIAARKARFYGFKPNAFIVHRMMKAFLVINPRPTRLALAEYSCPSKTIEAMALGVPFASSKLSGIPEDYWDYIFPLEFDSTCQLATCLEGLLSQDTFLLRKRGLDSKTFIRGRSRELVKTMLEFHGDASA